MSKRQPKPPATNSTANRRVIARTLAFAAAACLGLAACGSDEDGPPAGVSQDERQALEDAAEMLEAERLREDAAPGPDTETAPDPAA